MYHGDLTKTSRYVKHADLSLCHIHLDEICKCRSPSPSWEILMHRIQGIWNNSRKSPSNEDCLCPPWSTGIPDIALVYHPDRRGHYLFNNTSSFPSLVDRIQSCRKTNHLVKVRAWPPSPFKYTSRTSRIQSFSSQKSGCILVDQSLANKGSIRICNAR